MLVHNCFSQWHRRLPLHSRLCGIHTHCMKCIRMLFVMFEHFMSGSSWTCYYECAFSCTTWKFPAHVYAQRLTKYVFVIIKGVTHYKRSSSPSESKNSSERKWRHKWHLLAQCQIRKWHFEISRAHNDETKLGRFDNHKIYSKLKGPTKTTSNPLSELV